MFFVFIMFITYLQKSCIKYGLNINFLYVQWRVPRPRPQRAYLVLNATPHAPHPSPSLRPRGGCTPCGLPSPPRCRQLPLPHQQGKEVEEGRETTPGTATFPSRHIGRVSWTRYMYVHCVPVCVVCIRGRHAILFLLLPIKRERRGRMRVEVLAHLGWFPSLAIINFHYKL